MQVSPGHRALMGLMMLSVLHKLSMTSEMISNKLSQTVQDDKWEGRVSV